MNAVKIPQGATVAIELDGKIEFFKPLDFEIHEHDSGTLVRCADPKSYVWDTDENEWALSYLDISNVKPL